MSPTHVISRLKRAETNTASYLLLSVPQKRRHVGFMEAAMEERASDGRDSLLPISFLLALPLSYLCLCSPVFFVTEENPGTEK